MLQPRPWEQIVDHVQASAQPAIPRVLPFVILTAVLAALAAAVVSFGDTSAILRPAQAVLVLAAFGIGADALDYKHQHTVSGSIGFIPWTACAVISPSAPTLVAVGAASVTVQLLKRRHWLKAVFNVAQVILASSIAIIVYRALGGQVLTTSSGRPFITTAATCLLPTVAAVATYTLINAATVSGVVARSEGKPVAEVWRANSVVITPLNLLAGVVAFYLAWLNVNLGPFGAAGLGLPMLAIRQLYKATVQLTNVTQELLDLMVAAIEARDPYTSGHSKRVARASVIIAKGLGLTDRQVERIGIAALLHDVGKIDEAFGPILAKEGRLSDEEWQLMKRHPVRSAELVGHLSTLQDIVGPVRHHHERWDGTGYPDGLKEDQIPLASRIITFADTLDAMTTDRPYRAALGPEEARAEFLRCRGKQFDPQLCDQVVAARIWPELYRMFRAEAGTSARRRAS